LRARNACARGPAGSFRDRLQKVGTHGSIDLTDGSRTRTEASILAVQRTAIAGVFILRGGYAVGVA